MILMVIIVRTFLYLLLLLLLLFMVTYCYYSVQIRRVAGGQVPDLRQRGARSVLDGVEGEGHHDDARRGDQGHPQQ